MKKLWTGIKSIVNLKNKSFNNISQLISENGDIIKDSKQMAAAFNNFFVNVSHKINHDIPRTRKSPLDYMPTAKDKSFFVSPVTPEEIEIIIGTLKNGKSSGPYSIPTKLLKILSSDIAIPLSVIVNESFAKGVFPDKLKVAKVIALHKKESTDNPSNYRPISLLSIFSKVIETLMHKRLYNFLDLCNILYPNQFGFREKHLTNHALISITETIKSTIDNGRYGCGVFIDLQKAFDTVNHSILLKKLEHYGIRGTALKWFTSYLVDRQQYVSVNGHCSNYLNITCGVPQGSVLGPLLFLIYINDLPNSTKVLTFYLFADDTNIYFESSDLILLQKTINKHLKRVKKWLDANKLALNLDKTNFVLFHSYQKKVTEPVILKFCRKKIQQEKCVKFLGVLLDSALSWKYHLAALAKKLARTSGLFFKTRHLIPFDTIKLLYHAIFSPFSYYGIVVWGVASECFMNPVSVQQKKVIRAITFNDSSSPSEPLFLKLGLLKLDDIFNLQLVSFVYACINRLAPPVFDNYFNYISNIHDHSRQLGVIFLLKGGTQCSMG